ncbi:MAG: hypothetical protein MUC87_15550 [Bacteroidia bacterium]|jgi:hypothetical protein|nr:hypothetical protein [Bacteroidia bacterium]
MKKAIRLLVCFAVVCQFTEGIAQTYSGARVEFHRRLDNPVLTFIDPVNGSETGTFVRAKMFSKDFNAGVSEFTTVRFTNGFTLTGELGVAVNKTGFQFKNYYADFSQLMFDFRFLPGIADKRNIVSFQAGPTVCILNHTGLSGYSEKEDTRWLWFGSVAGVHLRINKAMFVARYNMYFTKGDIDFVNGGNSYFRLQNRRSSFSLGISVILSDGHN